MPESETYSSIKHVAAISAALPLMHQYCQRILSTGLPCEWSHGGAPGGVLQVGTQTIVSPVLSRPALHIGQEWWTDLSDQRL
jgi:hypothetical protein